MKSGGGADRIRHRSGKTALDGEVGTNSSPFARALMANIATPGIEIQQAMTKVRAQVNEEINKGQPPTPISPAIRTAPSSRKSQAFAFPPRANLEQKAARRPPFVAVGVDIAAVAERSGRKAVAAAPICEQHVGQMWV
jgi:hypothetical protein